MSEQLNLISEHTKRYKHVIKLFESHTDINNFHSEIGEKSLNKFCRIFIFDYILQDTKIRVNVLVENVIVGPVIICQFGELVYDSRFDEEFKNTQIEYDYAKLAIEIINKPSFLTLAYQHTSILRCSDVNH